MRLIRRLMQILRARQKTNRKELTRILSSVEQFGDPSGHWNNFRLIYFCAGYAFKQFGIPQYSQPSNEGRWESHPGDLGRGQ